MLHSVTRGQTAKHQNQYLFWVADELKKINKAMSLEVCREQAKMQLDLLLEEEKIEFGDPGWLWDEAAARDDAWALRYDGLKE